MKNKHIELMRRTMRNFHRHNPWKLDGGLFVPHGYPSPEGLTWWDDVGFIHDGRRVMVWWVHPRMRYADAIERKAFEIAGPVPIESKQNQRRLARSVRFNLGKSAEHELPDHLIAYFDQVNAIEDRLREEGIDHLILPSLKIQDHPWGTGMDLCAWTEIHNLGDIQSLARIAKRLIKREIQLDEALPSHGYSKEDWLREAEHTSRQTEYYCSTTQHS